MKKLLLTGLMMLGLGVIVNAQKGTTLLYGNFDFQSSKDYSQIGFNPGIGFGLNENWTLGANLGVYAQKDENPGFQVGPFLRYTKKLSDVFSLYGQLNAGYSNVEGTFKAGAPIMSNFNGNPAVNDHSNGKGSGFGASITPAIFINVKNGFGVNINFGGIGFESYKPDGGDSRGNFGITFGQGVGLGISKTFGGKK
jgi:hypothetical protein